MAQSNNRGAPLPLRCWFLDWRVRDHGITQRYVVGTQRCGQRRVELVDHVVNGHGPPLAFQLVDRRAGCGLVWRDVCCAHHPPLGLRLLIFGQDARQAVTALTDQLENVVGETQQQICVHCDFLSSAVSTAIMPSSWPCAVVKSPSSTAYSAFSTVAK